MSPEQWNRMVSLFHAACEKTGQQRVALLNSVCSGDPALRLALERMLADDKTSTSFFDRPPVEKLIALASSQTTPAEIGARFGRYELTHPIGCGGMGEVWAAHDTELDRPVALKFLFPAVGRVAERLTREAKAASALNHPNIVTVYEVVWHDDTPIIAMELVDGRALRALSGTPQPVQQVIEIGQQTARALAAAHAHGIVHCDIKPENILVRNDGYAKVLDFGIARHIERDAKPAVIGGTLRYMAPEQARGEAPVPASDVFSLGLVLYELATGRHAFERNSPAETMQAILTEQAAPPSSKNSLVPRSLDSLILSMLAREPAARPSAQEAATKLGEMLGNTQLAGSPRKQRQNRWLPVLACSLIVICLVWAIGRLRVARNNSPLYADLRIQPLTSQAGWESAPALSPDGQSIAFTWAAKLDGHKQIYVKQLDGTQPVQLTNSPSGDIGYLAWSPDGKSIAFKRQYGIAGAIYSIANTGGKERKMVDLEVANLTSAIDWSPDGTQLAFSDAYRSPTQLAIYLYNLRTRVKRKLTSPPPLTSGDWNPKFSPDGSTVAFKRVTGFWADEIYVVPAMGGSPRRVADRRGGIWGHAWTADDRSLILSWQRSGTVFGIWRLPLKTPAQPEPIAQGGVDAIMPSAARKTNRLAWVNQLWDLNIYRIAATGVGTPVKLIASTLRDQDATYSPDGRIAFISDRSGSREIWLAKADGSGQVQVTRLNGPPIDHLQWSQDGRSLVFQSRPSGYSQIFTLECDRAAEVCGKPKHLVTGGVAEAPSWAAHGKFIYFASDRTGRWEIWKIATSGGPAVQVTQNGGYMCRESRDGKWLYFTKDGHDSLWRVPGSNFRNAPAPGETLVIGPPYKVITDGWTLIPNEIVFYDGATRSHSAEIEAYNLRTQQMRSILLLNELFPNNRGELGISVSPDAQWILYSQLDRSGSNIMVADPTR